MGYAFLVRRVQASENPTSASILQDHDAFNAPFMEGSTFTTVLGTLKDERDLVFNDDNRKIILNVDEHSKELDYLITKIEEQINHYGEIKMGLNIMQLVLKD